MSVEPKELEIGEMKAEVIAVNGDHSDRRLKVTTVALSGEYEFDLINSTYWDDEEALAEEIKKAINGESEIPENKSSRIEFKNPEVVDGTSEIHKREYYESLNLLRDLVGHNINYVVGDWLVAIKEAEINDNPEKAAEVIEQLLKGYTEEQVSIVFEKDSSDREWYNTLTTRLSRVWNSALLWR